VLGILPCVCWHVLAGQPVPKLNCTQVIVKASDFNGGAQHGDLLVKARVKVLHVSQKDI
jgi:hypothetical protein